MADINPRAPSRVPVIAPDGTWGTMDVSEAQEAIQTGGFKLPTAEEVKDHASKLQYGTGTSNEVKAALAGAARAATFGLSDQLLGRTGTVDPNVLAELAKQNPKATMAGEIGGVAASLLIPGIGAGTAGEAVAAKGAAKGISALTPVGAVAKIGTGVTEAALPAAQKFAGLLVNPETSPIVHRILSRAGAQTMGSAVEGAVYGLGQGISEDALGDPNLTAEKLLGNIGYGALFAGGLGGLIGGIGGALEGIVTPEAIRASTKRSLADAGVPTSAPLTETEIKAVYAAPGHEGPLLREAIDIENMAPKEKASFLSSIQRQKKDAPRIIEAANELGAPLTEGILSDSTHIRRLDDALRTSPYGAGIAREELYKKGWRTAADASDKALGEVTGLSKSELGDTLQKQFTNIFEAKRGPVEQLYKEIDKITPYIKISKTEGSTLAENIRQIIADKNLIKGTPEYALVESFASGTENITNGAALRNFRQNVQDQVSYVSTPAVRHAVGAIRNQINAFEENLATNFVRSLPEGPTKASLMSLVEDMDKAKTGYKQLIREIKKVGKVLFGDRKIDGPQDFLDKIENMGAENFANKILSKNNAKAFQFLAKEFPEQVDLLARFEKEKIRLAATSEKGLNPKVIAKKVQSLPKEVRDIMFKPEELRVIDNAKTYISNFPENFNPSGTSSMHEYRGLLRPLEYATGWAKAQGISTLLKMSQSKDVQKLMAVEGASGKITSSISKMADSVFKHGKESLEGYGGPVTGFAGAKMAKQKEESREKTIQKIKLLNSNPEEMVSQLEKNTTPLFEVAPQVTAALHQKAIVATNFLASKAPQQGPQAPLSEDMPFNNVELQKFNRYYNTIDKPISVMKHLKNGTLSPEHIEALQTVYPTLYNEMKMSLSNSMATHISKNGKDTMPYSSKLSLSMFMGEDLVRSLGQQAIASNQATLMQGGKNQAMNQQKSIAKVTQSGLDKVTKASRYLTPMQATAQRGS